mgnify:FL=1
MTDSCLNTFDDSYKPKVTNPRPTVGARNPKLIVEARQQRLYRRQLEGLPARQLVLDHASKEGVSTTTAWTDWKQVNAWNNEDWQKDRENMLARLQAARLRLYEKAIRKGQLQTAAQVLDSIGKVIGESVEHVSIQAPELSIKVEPKQPS